MGFQSGHFGYRIGMLHCLGCPTSILPHAGSNILDLYAGHYFY